MFLKAVALLGLIVIILGLLYLAGSAIYDHVLNKRRKDAAELKFQADRLEQLLQKAQINER